jgi:hypothetical protein
VEVVFEEAKMNIGYCSHGWKIQAPASCSRYQQQVPAVLVKRSRNQKNSEKQRQQNF